MSKLDRDQRHIVDYFYARAELAQDNYLNAVAAGDISNAEHYLEQYNWYQQAAETAEGMAWNE